MPNFITISHTYTAILNLLILVIILPLHVMKVKQQWNVAFWKEESVTTMAVA